MKEFVISEAQAETAVLVGLVTKTQDERKTNEYLDELAFLAETAGAEVVKRFTQKLDQANSVTYVGKGKLEEIKEYIRSEEEAEREIGMVIFDDELSAKQIRNIEAELKIKILDRTSLILDIFAMRAQTANAKTQVELAQYKYMLPRLQRLWTHLERQGGGSGAGGGKGSVGLRGPGETQLEMDRRIILNRMSLLKERLAEIDKQKATQRKNRGREIELGKHQSSSPSSLLLTGGWSLSIQRRVSKLATRIRVKIGKAIRKIISKTKLDQPAPPVLTSKVSRTGTGISSDISGSTAR